MATATTPDLASLTASPAEHRRTQHRACPVCRRDNLEGPASEYSRDQWLLKNCGECGFLYLENAVTYEELSDDCAWTTSSAAEDERRWREDRVVTTISRSFRRVRERVLPKRDKCQQLLRRYFVSGDLLDIGCGVGNLFANLSSGQRGSGIEVDRQAAAIAQRQAAATGGRVVCADALAGLKQLDDASYDMTIMLSYLEHEVQPQPVLREVCRTLRPGGRTIIKVPNFGCLNRHARGARWCGFRYPDHVNYFDPASLRRVVEASGLVVDRFGTADRFPLSDNMWMVARRPD